MAAPKMCSFKSQCCFPLVAQSVVGWPPLEGLGGPRRGVEEGDGLGLGHRTPKWEEAWAWPQFLPLRSWTRAPVPLVLREIMGYGGEGASFRAWKGHPTILSTFPGD